MRKFVRRLELPTATRTQATYSCFTSGGKS